MNGKMDLKKDKVCGKAFLAIRTLESGCKVKLMGTAFTNGKMEIDSKVNGRCA